MGCYSRAVANINFTWGQIRGGGGGGIRGWGLNRGFTVYTFSHTHARARTLMFMRVRTYVRTLCICNIYVCMLYETHECVYARMRACVCSCMHRCRSIDIDRDIDR